MTLAESSEPALGVTFRTSFADALPAMSIDFAPRTASAPELLVLNDSLAADLGFDPELLRTPAGAAMLVGNRTPAGARPVAQAYAGHQFGGYSPRLGDGRAVLLGDVTDSAGDSRDIHLKGTGRTPFSRGGDGLASVGPMLREHIMCEAMHALGVPTTRSLAVVATGDPVRRETTLPGAVLARTASSHLRVGSFQYAAHSDDLTLVPDLLDHAVRRHQPEVAGTDEAALAFFDGVVERQAQLIARWMLIGFVHGVMNTDNCTISGETIDYGPCAFLDTYDPAAVYSSIDHGGRYAFGNQPQIGQWNLARLAETLLPLFHPEREPAVQIATERLEAYPDRFRAIWRDGMAAKLGLPAPLDDADTALIDDLLAMLHTQHIDYTTCFRALAQRLRGDRDQARNLFVDLAQFDAWAQRWDARLGRHTGELSTIAASMDAVNPVYIPRNHLVETALTAAVEGDLAPTFELCDVLADPFTARPHLDRFAVPAPESFGRYTTYCGT